MRKMSKACLAALGGAAMALTGLLAGASPVSAQEGQIYEPTIWIDPDGCEHWAMDDGAEGYMSPHRTRDGRPVCHRSEICGVVATDTLFSTDGARIGHENQRRLAAFFAQTNAFGYLIYGHTDSRASDEYNISLSDRRATAVAAVAQANGARVVDVRGFGERSPAASNSTAAGMQENRRVEIYCLR